MRRTVAFRSTGFAGSVAGVALAGVALACAFAVVAKSGEPAKPPAEQPAKPAGQPAEQPPKPSAEEPATLTGQGARPLQPLEFLLGHCWRGSFPDGKSVDTHCFEGVYGQFVRDRHIVQRDGPDYCGESVYWWDPRAGTVTYLYFNSDGGTSTGTMAVSGPRLHFGDEVYTAPDGRKQTYRTSWTRDETGYVSVTERQKQDGWKEAWRIEFRRLDREAGAKARERAEACQQ